MAASKRCRAKGVWLIVLIVIVMCCASNLAHAQLMDPRGTQPNYKHLFLPLVRRTMEGENARLSGTLTARFFSVGDPDRVITALNGWLGGVAISPYLMRLNGYTGPGATFADRDESRFFPRWIFLRDSLDDFEAHKTTFHEAIHAYHYAASLPSNVHDDQFEGPEFISSEFRDILGSLVRTREPEISNISKEIETLGNYRQMLDTFRQGIQILRRRMESHDPRVFQCLSNIGGKADWAGYEQEYEGIFKAAMAKSCPKVNEVFRKVAEALKNCEFDMARVQLKQVIHLSDEHLLTCGHSASDRANLQQKANKGDLQLAADKIAASNFVKTGEQACSTAKAAASEVVAARKSLESFNDELGNKLKIEPDMLRVKEDVARECAEVERLFREIDLKAKDARTGSSNVRVEYDKTEEARRKACDLATQAEKSGDKKTAVACGTQATEIARRAYDSMTKARDEATLAARVAGDAEADSQRLDGLIKKLNPLKADLPKKREELKKAIPPNRLTNVQATAKEAETKKEDASKTSQEAIDAESNLLSLWSVKECSGMTEFQDAVKKAHQSTLDTGQEADEALKSAEPAKKAAEEINKRVRKIQDLMLLIEQLERHLQTCTRKPDQFLDASAAKRASDDASGFATRAYANAVEAEKCAHRARMAGESLGEVDPATLEKMIVGNWKWFNVNLVEISYHKMVAKDGKGNILNSGSWSLSNAKNREFTLQWEKGGWVDKLTLSSDGKRLDGKNNAGSSVWGTRAK